jgi:hypothetical protein
VLFIQRVARGFLARTAAVGWAAELAHHRQVGAPPVNPKLPFQTPVEHFKNRIETPFAEFQGCKKKSNSSKKQS